jgi:hypothetical protein
LKAGRFLLIPAAMLVTMMMPLAAASRPCCYVTAIDAHTGLVTAKENTTGRPFQFVPTPAARTGELHVGSPVYADFGSRRVSLDGRHMCCNMLPVPTPPPSPNIA